MNRLVLACVLSLAIGGVGPTTAFATQLPAFSFSPGNPDPIPGPGMPDMPSPELPEPGPDRDEREAKKEERKKERQERREQRQQERRERAKQRDADRKKDAASKPVFEAPISLAEGLQV